MLSAANFAFMFHSSSKLQQKLEETLDFEELKS